MIDSPTNSKPGLLQQRLQVVLPSASPERRGRKAKRDAMDCGFCHGCQIPIHCCGKLIKRAGAYTTLPNQSPGESRMRGDRMQCHSTKPAHTQKKLIKNSYGWLLQSEVKHLCSSWTQRDLFILLIGGGTVWVNAVGCNSSVFSVLADAKKQKKEGKKRDRTQMDWWGLFVPGEEERRGWKDVHCPISTRFLFIRPVGWQ